MNITTIGSIAEVQTGPFGSQLHKEDYVSLGTPIVTVEHLGKRTFTTQNLPCVSTSDKKRLNKYVLKTGDIVFSRVGSVDRCSLVSEKENGWMFSGRCLRIRPHSLVDAKYLYYYFCLEGTKQFIRNIAVGATMPSINTKLISEIPISFPSKQKQSSIASILATIDDKIELNEDINHNLEQQAFSIYRNFFINNADTAWRSGTIDDLGSVTGGSTPSKAKSEYYTKKGIAWVTPKDLSINKNKFIARGEIDITELGLKNSSAKIMPRGTVLFSSRAPIGYIAIAKGNVTTNQGFKSVVPNSNIGTAYVYFFLRDNLAIIESVASGSTFKEVSGATMKNIDAIVPDDETLARFSDLCNPIFDQQELLENENATLIAMRDTLLPKLMSGEIDVAKVKI